MPEITHMMRFGRVFTILLDCGHKLQRTVAEVKLQQLYIGKRIGCEACARATEEGYDSLPGAAADARRSMGAHSRKTRKPLE